MDAGELAVAGRFAVFSCPRTIRSRLVSVGCWEPAVVKRKKKMPFFRISVLPARGFLESIEGDGSRYAARWTRSFVANSLWLQGAARPTLVERRWFSGICLYQPGR